MAIAGDWSDREMGTSCLLGMEFQFGKIGILVCTI